MSRRNAGGTAIKVMTLNLAHGRGTNFHQLLQRTDVTFANLDAIATLLQKERPDVVALQEADGPSFWSGNLDHVEYLASKGFFRQSIRGSHANRLGLSYGNALVSNMILGHPEAITFDPSLSLVPKGFVVSTISWPGSPCTEIDVVSVHLDFSSSETRQQQALELIGKLQMRNRTVIVMGDFNSNWRTPDSTVRFIAGELGLNAFRPDSEGMTTFPALGSRLDWILVSPELRFQSYRTLPDILSDHRAVVAELSLNI